MRIICEYKSDGIPLANNMLFVSLIKEALKKVNKDYYEKLYYYGDNNNKKIKNFTFSTFLKDFNIEGDIIYIKDKLYFNISSPDYEFGINIYNGLLSMNKFIYKNFTLNRCKISLEKEKFINSEEVIFKTMSAMCIKNKENNFLSPEDLNYGEELNYVVNKSIESFRGYGLKKELQFKSINMKKVVVKESIRNFKNITNKDIFYVNAYKGIFKLTGDIEDLNLIYQLGIGFRRSQGFGMIDIL